MSPARKRLIVGIAVSSGLMKQFWACQPRPAKSASASLTPAWIFSAVMPGGNAESEKSTVAGSKPTNRTRFIDPPKPRPYSAESDRMTNFKAKAEPRARPARNSWRVCRRVLGPDRMIWQYILSVSFNGLSRMASAAVAADTCSPIRRRARGSRLRRSINRLLQLIAIRRSKFSRTVIGFSLQMAWINKRPDDKHHCAGYAMNGERSGLPPDPRTIDSVVMESIASAVLWVWDGVQAGRRGPPRAWESET